MAQTRPQANVVHVPFRKAATPGRIFGTARLTMTLPIGRATRTLALGRMRPASGTLAAVS